MAGYHIQFDLKFLHLKNREGKTIKRYQISTIQTDRGHEFQPRFHCHVEAQGVQYVYIKPQILQLNGKVERWHRTGEAAFYQLLTYTDDVDLNLKLKAWENSYNYERSHLSLEGKTPYEVMKSLLQK